MKRAISVDFETDYDTKSGYGIKELGSWAYLNHERFNPYLISVSDGEDTWAGEPRDFNWNALEGNDALSHNKYFDAGVYETMVKTGKAPKVNVANWYCTANLSTFLCNRRALDQATEFLLGVKVSKEVRGYADGKTVAQMKAEGRWNDMLGYARGDAKYCHNIWAKYGHLWPERERRLSDLTINQGWRGVQIDRVKLDEYIVIAQGMLQRAESVLPWIQEGAKPTSPKAIAEHCRKCGIPSPPIKSREGEEVFEAWEATYGPKHPWIANISNRRRINKFLDTLLTIKQRLQPDNVLSFNLKYFGAHTGRWSGDAGINMQNLKKEPLFRDEDGFLVTQPSRLLEIGKAYAEAEYSGEALQLPAFVTAFLDIRSLFIARPGRKLIISDLSQIEPRVLAWLVGDKKMLESMSRGESPYEAHARATMNWTAGSLKKEDKHLYALAKARVLGLGFQCGWEKFITVAQDMAGLDITVDDPEFVQAADEDGQPCYEKDGITPKMISGYGLTSKRIVKEYREGNPLVVGLWSRLDAAFKASVGGSFEMELPSGRKLIYRNVRWSARQEYDKEAGKYKTKKVVVAEVVKNGRVLSAPLYGGLLTENLVQATARDVFGEHMLTLQDTSGIDVVFHVHDETVNECDQHVTVKDVESIMSKTPDWLKGCPISSEGCEAAHYKK
jgi:hypothetical protein